MDRVQVSLLALIRKHGGVRAAARATGLDPAQISRVSRGHGRAGPKVLKVLGLRERRTYL